MVLPIANSSIFVFPMITAPAFSRFSTASAVYVGLKLYNIFEEQVVSRSFVHILSLMATGTPASGPVSVPSSIIFCTSSARFNAPSRSTVTKLFTFFSFASIASKAAVTASVTVTSFAFIFLPNSTAVKLIKLISITLSSLFHDHIQHIRIANRSSLAP